MAITKISNSGVNGSKYDIVSADNYYMEPISSTLLSGSSATITFSNIPQIYKHLQLRIAPRGVDAFTYDEADMRFNGDTGSNYAHHQLNGNGSSTTSNGSSSATYIRIADYSGGSSGANCFGRAVIDILDYTNTFKYKTAKSLWGFEDNSSGTVGMRSGLWMNTAPITSITLTNSGTYAANSRFSLYGIRG